MLPEFHQQAPDIGRVDVLDRIAFLVYHDGDVMFCACIRPWASPAP
jgi:hypothetical protein